jgi:hypothetical protein
MLHYHGKVCLPDPDHGPGGLLREVVDQVRQGPGGGRGPPGGAEDELEVEGIGDVSLIPANLSLDRSFHAISMKSPLPSIKYPCFSFIKAPLPPTALSYNAPR